jgi:hypothetical protein
MKSLSLQFDSTAEGPVVQNGIQKRQPEAAIEAEIEAAKSKEQGARSEERGEKQSSVLSRES